MTRGVACFQHFAPFTAEFNMKRCVFPPTEGPSSTPIAIHF